jgi:phage-related tail fiber protein
VSFNGSANINLPGVNTAGNQNTSGTAAVSTAATVTTSATASAFKVPFANTTASTTGNYGLLQDSTATFTYNPSTNTLVVGTVSAALSGNATTATTLQTARTIGGVSFNGSANINLPGVNTAGNQNTSGTAANVTGTVAVANGGTGRTTLTANNVVIGNGTTAVNFVAPGTSGNVLTSNGTTWTSSAPTGVPSGSVIWFAANTAPTGYLKANGAAVSRTTYAALFTAIGTTYGAGNGSTTFNLPDLRGEFIRGWDDGRGVDSGRAFGSAQANGIPRMFGGIADSHGFSAMQPIDVSGFTNPMYGDTTSEFRTDLQVTSTDFAFIYFDSERVIPASPDVRPRNVALLACIKF